ncbi:DHA1 family bicyclomycin/chloramphenicol resistance-like MFS transporter [Rhodobium orientis]|uniref:Bcr/CflA family efflux transporter n=1 Tax=Rhodobium orientis TaxID=34017 RepID=A0A327JSV4_9HYPH|nr:multidrug effflux MFS transporter [Rhodobium orientis]MBB4304071.1 DHA1 family bicyclomycin/chloramphenicol resistance-like MFS transporter [Rhodobium orientis]MBK5950724.1 hypothetical protein [Rhodobium orientis]RAI29600.1 hypothetical protein CH339_02860 [Rhodobium orientis]
MPPAVADTSIRPPSLAILIAVSWINPLALNIFVPSMPGMIVALDTNAEVVQLTLSLYLGAVAIAQLVLGPLSDMFGRRPVVLAGMALFIVSSLICALAGSVEVLIAGRILQAAGGCAGIVLARSIVRDLFEQEKAASMIGYVTAGMAIAPLFAPAIGGVLDQFFGWRSSFFFVAALGVAVLIAAWFGLSETNMNRGRSSGFARMFDGFAILARYPLFWAHSLTLMLTTGVFFGFLGAAPFISSHVMHLTPSQYGFYFALIGLGYMTGNMFSGRYASRIGTRRLIAIGTVLALAAALVMLAAFLADIVHPIAMFGPMLFIGMANGMVIPATMSGAVSVRPDRAGAASGLAGSLQIGGGAIASYMITTLITTESGEIIALPLAIASTSFATAALIGGIATRFLHREE